METRNKVHVDKRGEKRGERRERGREGEREGEREIEREGERGLMIHILFTCSEYGIVQSSHWGTMDGI